MNTGIILEISNKKATVLKTDGTFITLSTKKHWTKGEIVTFSNPTIRLNSLYALAACFALLIVSSIFGGRFYLKETALLSLDINPSIEIGLNRLERVVSVTARNDEGKTILSTLSLKNKKYKDAMNLLINSSSLVPYIQNTKGITFSLQSGDKKLESHVMAGLQELVDSSIHVHHPATKTDFYTVTAETVTNAHRYGVTAGKYLALLDLQEVDPQVDLNVYSHHSIDSIRRQIKDCENEHKGIVGDHGNHCEHTDNGHK